MNNFDETQDEQRLLIIERDRTRATLPTLKKIQSEIKPPSTGKAMAIEEDVYFSGVLPREKT